MWLHVPLKTGTAKKQYPSTKKRRDLLATSATPGSITGYPGLDLSMCCVCTSKIQYILHNQVWLKSIPTVSLNGA